MALDLFVVIAAVAGSLFGSWMLLFLKYGRKLEAQEAEAEAIQLKLPETRTPEEVHTLKLWENRQSFLEKYKYRLAIGMLVGVGVSIGYIALFLNDTAAQTSVLAAALSGWAFGTSGAAVSNEMRETN